MKARPYKKYNHYVEYLQQLERDCPDIMAGLDDAIFEHDGTGEHTKEDARAYAISLVEGWISTLEAIRDELKQTTTPMKIQVYPPCKCELRAAKDPEFLNEMTTEEWECPHSVDDGRAGCQVPLSRALSADKGDLLLLAEHGLQYRKLRHWVEAEESLPEWIEKNFPTTTPQQ